MERACNACGRPFTPADAKQRRCPRHQGSGTGWSHNRDRAEQQRFRDLVLERDGYTCVDCGHHDPSGRTLRAAHLVALARGGESLPSNGRTRCERCDVEADPHARETPARRAG